MRSSLLSRVVLASVPLRRVWPLLLCALLARGLYAQGPAGAVTVCFVQTKEVHDHYVVSGGDAKALAKEFAGTMLANGAPLVTVELAGLGDKDVNPEVERRGCGWVVQVWRHDSVDVNQLSSLPANMDMVPDSPAPAPPPIGDRDAVLYRLRKAGSDKVLAHGSLPLKTRRGRSAVAIFDPYPIFAKQILKKMNQVE
jgi:hypothetical protein